MATLLEDIKSQSDWIVRAFASDGYKLDYSFDSIMEIDRFFAANMSNGEPKKGGRFPKKGFGAILFSMGSYIGETVIHNIPGTEWITDDEDPQAELNVFLRLPNGVECSPIIKVFKRFQNGTEEALYPYVHMLVEETTGHVFNQDFWRLIAEAEKEKKKPWWKFW